MKTSLPTVRAGAVPLAAGKLPERTGTAPRRFARKVRPGDVYPIFRVRDHRLIAVYVRDLGRIPA